MAAIYLILPFCFVRAGWTGVAALLQSPPPYLDGNLFRINTYEKQGEGGGGY